MFKAASAVVQIDVAILHQDISINSRIIHHKKRAAEKIFKLAIRHIAAHTGNGKAFLRITVLLIGTEKQIIPSVDHMTFRCPKAVSAPEILIRLKNHLRCRPMQQVI